MATNFVWGINTLERETSDGCVIVAHYTVNANDGVYNAGAYGSIGFERPPADELIPYSELTEELVLEWVRSALGGEEKVIEIQAALQAQLDEQHTPSKAAGTPWAA